tara:strand:+ start:296 stop:508 length:213 start_codon:yes stop_codon:yes gene_type:complete
MTVERVSQDELKAQFTERLQKLVAENNQLGTKMRDNEQQILKLQGAVETLDYLINPEPTTETPPEATTEE